MKKVVLCTETNWNKEPFNNIEGYNRNHILKAYENFFKTALKNNVKLIKSNLTWYDKKKNSFKKGWVFNKKEGWKQIFNFKADAVWDKSPFTKRFIPYKKIFYKRKNILNQEYIEKLSSDKSITKKIFRKFMPKDYIIKSKKDFQKYIDKIKTNYVVLKPTIGSSAKGVIIKRKKDLEINQINFDKTMLLQEFIKCNKKKFNFPHGAFDFRVVIANGKIIDAFYRLSKIGTLTSNVSTGGKSINVSLSRIPKKVLIMIKIIDKKIGIKEPRLYTLDFIIDENNKYWLIEINAKPGFTHFKENEYWRRSYFEKEVIKLLKKL